MPVKTKAKKKTVESKKLKAPTRKAAVKTLTKRFSKMSSDVQSRGADVVSYLGTKEGKSTAVKAAIGVAAVAAAGVGIVYATRYFKKRIALRVPDVETKEGSPNEESPLKSLPDEAPSRKVYDDAKVRGSNERRRNALKQANRQSEPVSLKNRASYNRTSHS